MIIRLLALLLVLFLATSARGCRGLYCGAKTSAIALNERERDEQQMEEAMEWFWGEYRAAERQLLSQGDVDEVTLRRYQAMSKDEFKKIIKEMSYEDLSPELFLEVYRRYLLDDLGNNDLKRMGYPKDDLWGTYDGQKEEKG